ncbi:hypothetical protein RN001_005868 [Aquatica leii]|uniref:Uncharacterized protein n=1 Tax=Aquatica leii TaxID=1421715 RepID=A0AAN7PCW9_9COLE|nr:hypothetical protein RN001_005868 [Aquatica leii]
MLLFCQTVKFLHSGIKNGKQRTDGAEGLCHLHKVSWRVSHISVSIKEQLKLLDIIKSARELYIPFRRNNQYTFSGRDIIDFLETFSTKQLCEDLKNIPYHVFGNHSNCRTEYCTRKKNNEEIYIPLLQTTNRITRNVTTNYAERYMSLVSKFSGGKRVNYVLRGSYQRQCYGAALCFNSGSSWHKYNLPDLNERHRITLYSRKENMKRNINVFTQKKYKSIKKL